MTAVGPFPTEAALHAEVTQFFGRLGIPHRNQHPVGDGAADIALELPDGRPWALLELKNDLDAQTLSLAAAADYFEQAMKYRLASGLPVFVGPFLTSGAGVVSDFLGGGDRPRTIAALSALAGRADVGLFFLHAIRGFEAKQSGWFGFQLVLRQARAASYVPASSETVWPTEPLRLVDLSTAGSRKDRGACS